MTDHRVADTAFPAEPPRQRYDFREHLGSGGMADVYRARDTELGRDVAVKVFRATDDTVADLQRREREIRLLSRLNHPGLVDVYDAGTLQHEGQARRYVVMEYVDGRSLAHRLARGPMMPRQVADVGAQVADALSHVHGQSIVHRDVKPENILIADMPSLGYTITAKLADFGVAQFVDGSRLTSDGTIMGTAAYISPEQARGEGIGPPSDVYSLGLVLLEALRGEREYTGSAIEAALARLHRPPEIPEDLPGQWPELLEAMTSDDPAERPTAHDVAATMRDIIRGMITSGRGKHQGRRARGGSRAEGRRGGSPRAPKAEMAGAAGSTRGAVVVGVVIGLVLALAAAVTAGVVAGVVAL